MNMAVPQSQTNLSSILSQVASIVSLSSTSLGLSRQDKGAARQSDMVHNAQQGVSKVSVSRLAGSGEAAVKAVNSLVAEIQADLKAITTAWGDDRMLVNQNMTKWLEIWTPKKRAYDELVADIKAHAQDYIDEAERNKGTYNIAPPSIEDIEKAFSLEFDMKQVPDSSNFKPTGLSQQMEAEMRRRFEAGIEAAYQNATTDALQRVAKPMGILVERMAAFEQKQRDAALGIENKGGKLYETVITNVQDIAKVFRSFNVTGDALMESIADKLETFDGIDIEDLKKEKGLRDVVTKKAEEILADLKDLI